VSCLGHGHPDVLRAMHEQIDRIAYAHTSFFTTEIAEQLAYTREWGAQLIVPIPTAAVLESPGSRLTTGPTAP